MAAEIATGILTLVTGNGKQSPAAGLFKWDKRPVNDNGDLVEEGDQIKLKVFVKAPTEMPNRYNPNPPVDYWHAESIGAELDDGGWWMKSLGAKHWDKSTVFTVRKVKNRAANEYGWGLNAMLNGKSEQFANNGDWISSYHQKLYHNVSLAALADGSPRQEGPYLYAMYYESRPHNSIWSGNRMNVKHSGKHAVFMFMRANQPDPNPDEKMSDTLGEEPTPQ